MSNTHLDIKNHTVDLQEHGYTIVHDVISSSEIETTKRVIDETLETEQKIANKVGVQTDDLRVAFEVQGKHPHFYTGCSQIVR